jgi:hypothetical protein
MKRYLMFAGSHYYPCGGWEDFKGCYDTVEEAEAAARAEKEDWTQVVDTAPGGGVWDPAYQQEPDPRPSPETFAAAAEAAKKTWG